MEKQILKAVEEAYRKGLQDAKGLNDISPFLLTSQIVAHEVANKFCQPLVSGSLPLFKCKCGYETSNSVAWCVHADCCNGNDR